MKENDRIESFERNIKENEKMFNYFLTELSGFYNESSDILHKFQIENSVIKEPFSKADALMSKLKRLKFSLNKLKYGENLMVFKANESDLDQNLSAILIGQNFA
jgi:predicted nuclease with TOPRIM domain